MPNRPREEEDGLNLPINSMSELEEMENALKDPQFFQKVAKRLSLQGGRTLNEAVRRVMTAFLSMEVSCLLNWAGRGEKTGFRDLLSRRLVMHAVRSQFQFHEACEKKMEEFIKCCLKYAPTRLKEKRSILEN